MTTGPVESPDREVETRPGPLLSQRLLTALERARRDGGELGSQVVNRLRDSNWARYS
jgi:hypothetical protein